jgi:phospholipase C
MRFIAKILLLSVSVAATFAYAQPLPTFQHIIVIVQENRTPDNLFGSNTTFEPGVDLEQPASGQWCLGACFDPLHNHAAWENDYGLTPNWCNPSFDNKTHCGTATCNGKTITQMPLPGCPQESYVSNVYDGNVVAPYFEIAENYGFANYFFQTNQGPSFPAHQFLFSGTSAPTQSDGSLYQYFAAEIPTIGADTGCAGA